MLRALISRLLDRRKQKNGGKLLSQGAKDALLGLVFAGILAVLDGKIDDEEEKEIRELIAEFLREL